MSLTSDPKQGKASTSDPKQNQTLTSDPKQNQNLTSDPYQGKASTLCVGCGHDQVSKWIQQVFKNSNYPLSQVVKVSGIGCSAKTTNYFLSGSHGIHTLHGRAAPIASGIHTAQPDLKILLVSGDGDSLNIGLGHFLHLIRRNEPIVYILENQRRLWLDQGAALCL